LIGAGTSAPSSSADTRPLKKVLAELDALVAAREGAKSDLQSLSNKDDIVTKLLNAPSLSHEQVFGEELRKYEALQGKLRDNYIKQDALLASLSAEHQKFVAARNADVAAQAARDQKEQALTKLANAFKAYNEVKAGLREGINFYTNLQELLQTYKSKCSDFVQARDLEKADLILQIQNAANQPPSTPQYQSSPQSQFQNPSQQYPGQNWPAGAPPAPYGSFQPTHPPYAAAGYPIPPPQYNQPPPAYNQQPPPGYGQQPPPGYGQQPPPAYNQPPPPYGYRR